ncbi:MAG: hypothetical protein ABSG43_30900 [Solirubrobacteraceae bacterium]
MVREPVGHARGEAVTAHDPMHGDRGQGEGLLVRVAAEANEQGIRVEQRDAARERMDGRPHLERLLGGLGDRDLALAPALAVDERARRPRSSAERRPQSPSTRSSAWSRLPASVRRSPTRSRLA